MLIPCPHCSIHVKPSEKRCPHCGESVRRVDGTLARTAGALALGILAAGCGDETQPMPAYGVPDVSAQSTSTQATSTQATTSASGTGGASQGGAGGMNSAGGAGGNGGSGGEMAMPAYGVAGFSQ